MLADSNAGPSVFPIIIKYASEADALNVSQLNNMLDGIIQQTATREEVVAVFLDLPRTPCLDVTRATFYAAWQGNNVGVLQDLYIPFFAIGLLVLIHVPGTMSEE